MRKTGLRCWSIAPSLCCRLDCLAWLALLIASLSALPPGVGFFLMCSGEKRLSRFLPGRDSK